jgi:hypothetical protein
MSGEAYISPSGQHGAVGRLALAGARAHQAMDGAVCIASGAQQLCAYLHCRRRLSALAVRQPVLQPVCLGAQLGAHCRKLAIAIECVLLGLMLFCLLSLCLCRMSRRAC